MPYRYGNWAFVAQLRLDVGAGRFGTWNTVTPIKNPPARFNSPRPPVRGTATVMVGRPFVGASTGIPQRVLVKNGSAGMGIPRGTVNNLNKVSREVHQNGMVMVHSAPPARTFGGSSGGWSSPGSSGGHMGGGG